MKTGELMYEPVDLPFWGVVNPLVIYAVVYCFFHVYYSIFFSCVKMVPHFFLLACITYYLYIFS